MTSPKEATKFTKKANQGFYKNSNLDWENKQDQEFAQKGFIAKPKDQIKDKNGNIIWSNKEYEEFETGKAPDSVNPSLWRIAKLNNNRGLFKVTDNIYQIRGQSLSNITFIVGKTGYIIIDPNISKEVAANNLEFIFKHLGKKPVKAVCYSHSHIDHWGGVRGVVSEDDVKKGKTKIIASKGFVKYAISENLFAGNAMSRRAQYMYGNMIPKSAKGQVDCALGKTTEGGEVTMILPTEIIDKEGAEMTIDGVKMIFQFASGEAPTGMHVYFPDYKTIHVADNCYPSLHNVYTIRGAYTRDAIDWSQSIDRAMDKFTDVEFLMGGHNWPIFGNENIQKYMAKERDSLKYLHDQTLRLINKGYTEIEIANELKLPPNMEKEWFLRGYYGSLKHDVRGIYSKYMGWYDANPTNLDPLPPHETGKMIVKYMGGARHVIKKAQKEFDKGEYRGVAQIMDLVVWAEPKNKEARNLGADALEQLGYQTENATWRNAYLTAASELRDGVKKAEFSTTSTDAVKAMPLENFFDYLGILLNGPKAFGKKITINWDFTDLKKKYILTLENGVLNHKEGVSPTADLSLTLTRKTFEDIIMKKSKVLSLLKSGKIKTKGKLLKLRELFGMLDKFSADFPIATHEEKK